MFFRVLFWPKGNNVAFWEENAHQQTKTGGQDGKYLHSYRELPRRADICRDKCDPDCTEYQHAEGDEFSFIEIIRQLSC